MGLAIDGNVVHGIARGGQAFVSVADTNADGSINISGQDYLNVNKMKLKGISSFHIDTNVSNAPSTTQADITRDLSNYAGYWAICTISPSGGKSALSQPFIIPTAPTTENLSSAWPTAFNLFNNNKTSLSRTTDNKFIFICNTSETYVEGEIYILSNTAS